MKNKAPQPPPVSNVWPGDHWPDLVGLPEPSRIFTRQCIDAKDKGAGLMLAYLVNQRLLHVKNTDQRYVFNILDDATGHGVWRLDYGDLQAEQMVELVALVYLREAAIVNDEIKTMGDPKSATDKAKTEIERLTYYRKSLFKAVDKLRGEAGLRATLRFAKPKLAIMADQLDTNPNLLVCPNITVDLGHGAKSRPGRPEDYCTMMCRVEWHGIDDYDDLVDRVFLEIHNDNQTVNDYVWRWMGRATMGDALPHEILVLHGARGRNGKDVELGIISYVLGDYAGVIPPELLIESRFPRDANAPTPALFALKGKRIVVASETSENQKAATGPMKRLSGGGRLTARGVQGKHSIEFNPSHSIVLMTNHKLKIPPGDAALWARIRLIEYARRFIANGNPNPDLNEFPADETLLDKLKERGPAVLAKLVRGCLEAQRDGLTPPPEVRAAIDGYQKGEDLVRQWLDDRCEIGEGFTIPAREGHKNFKEWYHENISDTFNAPGPKKYSEELSRFLKKDRNSSGNIYVGARLKSGF